MLPPGIADRGAGLFLRYLRAASHPDRINWHRVEGGKLEATAPETIIQSLLDRASQRTILISFWNSQALLLLAGYAATPAIQRLATRFEAVADDSPGGQITQSVFAKVGLRLRLIRYRSQSDRLSDLAKLMEDRPNIVLAVDSHGPYKVVGIPTARLAKRLNYLVLPIGAVARRDLKLFRHIGMSLPLPGATIEVAVGPLIEPRNTPLAVLSEAIGENLRSLQQSLK